MIFAHDKGRLCNNMLQYGHVYAWGREHQRSSMSLRFAYKYQYFHICQTARHNFLLYVLAKYGARWGLLKVVRFDTPDTDMAANEELMRRHSHVLVEGWYARWYDLFLKYKAEIIDLFAFNRQVMARPDGLLASLPKADLRLGLHIRRGDYKTWCDGRYYYSNEQYIGFVKQFMALHPGKTLQLIVCGNDRELCQDEFREALKGSTIVFPCGSPGEDLYLLSQCDYLIGPPSTFSLVAAMYRDVPLCWVHDPQAPLLPSSFRRFDELFREIV